MTFRIHPDSISLLNGRTYADVVAAAAKKSGLSADLAEALIDPSLFTPPFPVTMPDVSRIDDLLIDEAFSAFDALSGGETDERTAFRAGYIAGRRLETAVPVH